MNKKLFQTKSNDKYNDKNENFRSCLALSIESKFFLFIKLLFVLNFKAIVCFSVPDQIANLLQNAFIHFFFFLSFNQISDSIPDLFEFGHQHYILFSLNLISFE